MTASEPNVTDFQRRVYAALRRVPRGRVTTYRRLGEAIGCRSPRAVGQALRVNPFAPEVPCHRVIREDGSLGGFAGQRAGEAIQRKTRLLREEGVAVEDGHVVTRELVFSFEGDADAGEED